MILQYYCCGLFLMLAALGHKRGLLFFFFFFPFTRDVETDRRVGLFFVVQPLKEWWGGGGETTTPSGGFIRT